MKHLLCALTLCLGLASCSSQDVVKPLAQPIAQGRAAARVNAEEMVVGEPITQALKDWAEFNATQWDELWLLVKDGE